MKNKESEKLLRTGDSRDTDFNHSWEYNGRISNTDHVNVVVLLCLQSVFTDQPKTNGKHF